jgi:hypothetical protein
LARMAPSSISSARSPPAKAGPPVLPSWPIPLTDGSHLRPRLHHLPRNRLVVPQYVRWGHDRSWSSTTKRRGPTLVPPGRRGPNWQTRPGKTLPQRPLPAGSRLLSLCLPSGTWLDAPRPASAVEPVNGPQAQIIGGHRPPSACAEPDGTPSTPAFRRPGSIPGRPERCWRSCRPRWSQSQSPSSP